MIILRGAIPEEIALKTQKNSTNFKSTLERIVGFLVHLIRYINNYFKFEDPADKISILDSKGSYFNGSFNSDHFLKVLLPSLEPLLYEKTHSLYETSNLVNWMKFKFIETVMYPHYVFYKGRNAVYYTLKLIIRLVSFIYHVLMNLKNLILNFKIISYCFLNKGLFLKLDALFMFLYNINFLFKLHKLKNQFKLCYIKFGGFICQL